MGLLSRLVHRLTHNTVEDQGSRFEAQGRLEEAYEAYVSSGQLEQAIRVLLVRADSELDLQKRLALLQVAVSRTAADSPFGRETRQRAASLRLDLAKNSKGSMLQTELLALAELLESLDMKREAADAFGLLGDSDNQSRLLAGCGAIDALESLLENQQEQRNQQRQREDLWKEIHRLEAIGQRIACLKLAQQWLESHPEDEPIAAFSRAVNARLIRSNGISLRVNDEVLHIVTDHPLTLGRADCSIDIPSPALSRQHLQVRRAQEQLIVEDLGSRNGTWLAGVRLDGPLPIGNGIDLLLGGQVPLHIEPWNQGVSLRFANQHIVAPLGPLLIADFTLCRSDTGCMQLHGQTNTPILNDLSAEKCIDLAIGDKIKSLRSGPVLLEVIAS
ncbi:MAG TPA: FHA domain-containing protein [Polyangiaceae bacterium]|jgi:hypothetical protein|nr:MAG: FHA domain protein [Deltaproteobacteria bacterium ADurb.Bin207]HNS99918.1 FHA domain-containing protein [Polyangiaceae bacterium]HNZ25004.1 FHA domain-containing protein [Polyangiaceae bacterium]HOD23917.1 FHA domain-containing protein [Polyangiaceae bacterium]HOH03082.1 FHA domain-containing protein [Polyangiaceae bacterium]